MHKQRHEFDDFIQKYRENQNEYVKLSGETGDFFAEYKVQKMCAWFPELVNKPISMLDYGCGDGLMTKYARSYFPQATVCGIDPSAKSIEFAQYQYGNSAMHFSLLTDDTLPYADKSMDLIYAAGVFHHIPFDEHRHFVGELARITKPGGKIIIFELNPFNPMTVLTFKRSPIDRNATMLFPRYSTKLLKPFGAVETKYYCFFPAFARKLRFLEPYLTKLPLGALYATILTRRS